MHAELAILAVLVLWFACGAAFVLVSAARSGFRPRSLREMPPPPGVIRKIGPNGGSRRRHG